jgi:hypothetical protein
MKRSLFASFCGSCSPAATSAAVSSHQITQPAGLAFRVLNKPTLTTAATSAAWPASSTPAPTSSKIHVRSTTTCKNGEYVLPSRAKDFLNALSH